MIASIKHKGLRRLYERDDASKISPILVDKVTLILADLDAADNIEHLRQPGYRLHELRGNFAGIMPSMFPETGALHSVLKRERLLTLTSWITTERNRHHADEKSTPPR